jgi:peroxiredoxin family protein
MPYRLTKDQLFEVLEEWNRRLKRKVHLIACGGTAMTLLGVKASTKDVDLIAPVPAEYDYLIRSLRGMG